MHLAVGGVELVRPVHNDAQDARMRPIDQQPRKARIAFVHGSFSESLSNQLAAEIRATTSRTSAWRWILPVGVNGNCVNSSRRSGSL